MECGIPQIPRIPFYLFFQLQVILWSILNLPGIAGPDGRAVLVYIDSRLANFAQITVFSFTDAINIGSPFWDTFGSPLTDAFHPSFSVSRTKPTFS